MAQVLAFTDDIFFQSKLLETAKQVGVEVRTCATLDALDSEMAKGTPNLVVVDLNASAHPLDAVVRVQARGGQIPLIGFLSHVQRYLAEQARAAGCREVIPRSKFTENLATILSRAKSES
jgi:DNA-binding NarL/FixJ family response regulator